MCYEGIMRWFGYTRCKTCNVWVYNRVGYNWGDDNVMLCSLKCMLDYLDQKTKPKQEEKACTNISNYDISYQNDPNNTSTRYHNNEEHDILYDVDVNSL